MEFEWREFLALANFLKGHQGEGYSVEASHRTAISRAYYAAFCSARNYAQSRLSFEPQGDAGDHGRLKAHFKQLRGRWFEVASKLDRLRLWRNMCDYENTVANLEEYLKLAFFEAEKVLRSLR